MVKKLAGGSSLLLMFPKRHLVAVLVELARRVRTLEFAEPPDGLLERALAGRRR